MEYIGTDEKTKLWLTKWLYVDMRKEEVYWKNNRKSQY